MPNLYSYSYSWVNSSYAKTLTQTIRRTYFVKAFLLLLALPFDIIYYIYFNFTGKQFNCLIATDKWPALKESLSKKLDVATISPPYLSIFNSSKKTGYIPASPIYLLVTFGLFLPKRFQIIWSRFAVNMVSRFLRAFSSEKPTFIVHSDALPFGRSLVLSSRILSGSSICIQHGIFHKENIISERDGHLCDYNIVRSSHDAEIIHASSKDTKTITLPDFFLRDVIRSSKFRKLPTILLLGEGYHIIDKSFSEKYVLRLRELSEKFGESSLDVIFRPHPSERNRDWSDVFPKVDHSPLDICLGKVDAVVGFSSTVLQESAEIGIPSFSIPIDDKRSDLTKIIRNNVIINSADNEKIIIIAANRYFLKSDKMPSDGRKGVAINKIVSLVMKIENA